MSTRIGMLAISTGSGAMERLSDRFSPELQKDVCVEHVNLEELFAPQIEAPLQRLMSEGLRWAKLRQMLLELMSYWAAYKDNPQDGNSLYRRVHRLIRSSVDSLERQLGTHDAPIVIVAHSLGCQVISDYIWDAQTGLSFGTSDPGNDFQRLYSTAYLFSTGCSIPLFVSGAQWIEAFRPPNEHFEWINFYDPDDLLGWPLKPLSGSYDRIVTEDVKISLGGFLSGRNPAMSHRTYWEDNDFLNPVANRITELHTRLKQGSESEDEIAV